MITLERFEREIKYANEKTYQRAKKNGVGYHRIRIKEDLELMIKFVVNPDDLRRLIKQCRINDVYFEPVKAITKIRKLIEFAEKLRDAEKDAAGQARRKGGGRVAITLSARRQIVVFAKVSTRNSSGATFRYEVNGSPMIRDRLFDSIYRAGGKKEPTASVGS